MVINVHKLNFKRERLINIPAGIFLIQNSNTELKVLWKQLLD